MFYALGIDPSLAAPGIAIVEIGSLKVIDCITIKTKKSESKRPDLDIIARVNIILSGIKKFLSVHKDKKITIVGVESPAIAARGHVLQLGGVYYSILKYIVSSQPKADLIPLPPMSIKKIITNSGRADKDQIENGLKRLGIDISMASNDNEFDAISAAITAILVGELAASEPLSISLDKDQIKSLSKLV